MSRVYEPSPKHKWPKGFGSLCPKEMPESRPQELLEKAITVAEVGENKLWSASGAWCFCAHRSEGDVWHGFPVIGGEVDERVLQALREAGVVTERQVRRLRAQRGLPKGWP